ncbi:MAG: thermonuclease family protein [Planktomarina sp.]|nr:thermonuclease family protein [Planktomarina sp.]
MTKKRRFKKVPSNSILFVMFGIFFLALSRPEMFTITYLKNQFNDFISEDSKMETDSRAASILSGRITHVRDGDTFEVNGVPVRISALNCAEDSTNEGQKITRYAKRFKGKQAICELTGAKTYDRVVGYCFIDGKDFAQTMMDNTSCKLWAKYDVWNRY